MRPLRVILTLFVVLLVVFSARSAKAGVCWGYDTFDSEDCTGAHGCFGSRAPTYCSFGCISGTCNNQGNSTECCGTSHYIAQITPDGDSCDAEECTGGSGVFRTHASVSHVNSEHSAERRQGYSPGLIMLSANMSYKPARLIYVFNRCSHSFKLIVEDGRLLTTGGL